MTTYAEYLNTMTVKALNAIARDMGLKGYSKLRKADLIIMLDNAIAALVPVVLDVEKEADRTAIREMVAAYAVEPVIFSDVTPVKAPESVPAAPEAHSAQDSDPSEILFAYRGYRAAFRTSRGATQVKIGNRLRTLSAQLRALGYTPKFV
jgi:hypothetical protein